MFEFAKEMYFDEKASGKKSKRDKFLKTLLQSPAIMSTQISTIFVPKNCNELHDRKNLLLPEKQAGNISYLFNEKIVATNDKFSEYKCMSIKQHSTLVELFSA